MEVTIRVTIPDPVFIRGVDKLDEASFKSVIEKDLNNQLSLAEAKAKNVVQGARIPDMGKQIKGGNEDFDNALDVLGQLPDAHRALTEQGVQVSINKD